MLCLEKKWLNGWVSSAQFTIGIFSAKVHLGRDWVLREECLWADLPWETNKKKNKPNCLLSRPWKLSHTRTDIPSWREFSLEFSQSSLGQAMTPSVCLRTFNLTSQFETVTPTSFPSVLSEKSVQGWYMSIPPSCLLETTLHKWLPPTDDELEAPIAWNCVQDLVSWRVLGTLPVEAWGVGNFEGNQRLTFKS